ncbi:MAG: zinc-ribbon domain-containing protein [Erysipelotrichaceae bacterium]|nr:zinc-ribbon domain-containing protein [Erysipelotrichaceae bacterium]
MHRKLIDYPEIVSEWNYKKNGDLLPSSFAAFSGKKIYWTCKKCNGTWLAEISSRMRGSGCPYCSGRSVLQGYNDLQTLRPELAKQWDFKRNDFGPDQIQQFSMKKAFWICDKGHSYEMAIANRSSQNQGCPYCVGKKVLKGFNDLASRYPELIKEWDFEKNLIKPDEVTYGSNRSVYWNCKTCGNSWKATICSRSVNGQGCLKCGNKKGAKKRIGRIINERGSLQDKHPELLKDWDYDKNSIKPSEITPASSEKVFWVCDKGHSYEMSPANRTSGKQRCPYCASKRILIGFNDLDHKFPKLSKYWDYEKNYPLTPKDVFPSDLHARWWICPKCGESYKMSPDSRKKNTEHVFCRKCSRRQANAKRIKGMVESGNSLANLYPEIAKEWHPTKNGSITPHDITSRSGRNVWWVCSRCGKEWKQSIHTRTKGEGCPFCARAYQTSEPEQVVFYYIKKFFPDAINSYKDEKLLGRREIDIYIPSLKIGIEYDGLRWHKDEEKDYTKTKLLNSKGIQLVRIRERGLPRIDDGSYIIEIDGYYKDRRIFNEPIKQLIFHINNGTINTDIDVERDYQEVISLFDLKRESRSLATVRPELIKEWHPTKNGKLTPYNVSAGSNHNEVWWICSKCGFEWKTPVARRTTSGHESGCPMCGRRRVAESAKQRNLVVGETDLATVYPEIAREWDYGVNKTLPNQHTSTSNEMVSWVCSKGHIYKAKISSRTKNKGKGTGCPYCSNTKVLKGYNDLGTTDHILAEEWDYEKNDGLTPSDITRGSKKEIWWKCKKCGHAFHATPNHRIRIKNNGSYSGCPNCRKK